MDQASRIAFAQRVVGWLQQLAHLPTQHIMLLHCSNAAPALNTPLRSGPAQPSETHPEIGEYLFVLGASPAQISKHIGLMAVRATLGRKALQLVIRDRYELARHD
jgi:hypothetical protein